VKKEVKHGVLIYWPGEMKFFVAAVDKLLKKDKYPVSCNGFIRVNDAEEAKKLVLESKFSPQSVVFVSGVDEKVGERERRSLKKKFPEARFFRFNSGVLKEE
jgi:hypothetical protein